MTKEKETVCSEPAPCLREIPQQMQRLDGLLYDLSNQVEELEARTVSVRSHICDPQDPGKQQDRCETVPLSEELISLGNRLYELISRVASVNRQLEL